MHKSQSLARKLVTAIPFTSFALLGLKKSSNDAAITAKEVLLAKADALFEQGEYKQIYDILQNYRVRKAYNRFASMIALIEAITIASNIITNHEPS